MEPIKNLVKLLILVVLVACFSCNRDDTTGIFYPDTPVYFCNAGITYGAIAVYEDYPELAREVIDREYNTITLAKADYEPDGGYPQGICLQYLRELNIQFSCLKKGKAG